MNQRRQIARKTLLEVPTIRLAIIVLATAVASSSTPSINLTYLQDSGKKDAELAKTDDTFLVRKPSSKLQETRNKVLRTREFGQAEELQHVVESNVSVLVCIDHVVYPQ